MLCFVYLFIFFLKDDIWARGCQCGNWALLRCKKNLSQFRCPNLNISTFRSFCMFQIVFEAQKVPHFLLKGGGWLWTGLVTFCFLYLSFWKMIMVAYRFLSLVFFGIWILVISLNQTYLEHFAIFKISTNMDNVGFYRNILQFKRILLIWIIFFFLTNKIPGNLFYPARLPVCESLFISNICSLQVEYGTLSNLLVWLLSH